MRVITWLDRLTDDSNLWLTAVRLEERGDLAKAITLYLEDATKCLTANSLTRAALGGSCAADCLAKGGDTENARAVYNAVARLYWESADSSIGVSVRESLWSLQEAHESFLLAGERENAETVKDLFDSLANRANPFIGDNDEFRLPSARNKIIQSPTPGDGCPDVRGSAQVGMAVESFLKLYEQRRPKVTKSRVATPATTEEEVDEFDATSFIGQLG